jgi:uncharacterized membrane protein YdjX (TVP38/TMEM64 family)
MKKKKQQTAAQLKRRYRLVNLIGFLLLIIAGALVVLLFFSRTRLWEYLWGYYELYRDKMVLARDYLVNLPNVWWIFAAVLALYFLKTLSFPIPLPLMCMPTGFVFPEPVSYAVNIIGMIFLVSAWYFLGKHQGGGQVQKILERNRMIRGFMKSDHKGKPWLLLLFRLVPVFPLNSVSKIYGAMEFDYVDYLLISVLGFLPKLYFYNLMGKNASHPLSFGFLIPLIILFALSGISVIGANGVVRKWQGGQH